MVSSKSIFFCILLGFVATLNCKENLTSTNVALESSTQKKVVDLSSSTSKDYSPSSKTEQPFESTTFTAIITSTTESPDTTTSTIPPTTSSTSTTTSSTSTTTSSTPTTTSTKPTTSTTTPPPVVPTTPAPPQPCHHFDGPSFIGGIVLTLGFLAIGLVAYKFYKARNERNYHTL